MPRFPNLVRRAFAYVLATTLLAGQFLPFSQAISVAHAAGGGSLAFGGDQYIEVTDNGTLWVATNLTVEAWAEPQVSGGYQDIAGKSGYEIAVQQSGSGFIALMEVSIQGTWYTIKSGQFSYGPWYHIAGTYDGSALRLFVNGVQVASSPLTGAIDPATTSSQFGTRIQPFRIASIDGTGDTFTGLIDEVRVSNVIRYTGSFTPPTTAFLPDINTKGLWHLNEGAGTTTADASSFGNPGRLVGGPTWSVDTNVTTPAPDTTAPVISTIAASPLDGGATVTWTTNEPATSLVEYGPTSSYGLTTVLDQVLTTAHSVSLAALTPSSTFNYRVLSSDTSGNQSVSSNLTVTTTSAPPSAATQGEWGPLMNWPLVPVSTAELYNGQILVFDAWEMPGTPSVRLWNVNTGTFIGVPNEWAQMFCSASAQLSDGRLMIAGGHMGGETGNANTAIFDPAKGMWIHGPDMHFGRWYGSGTTMGDGRVVAVSGEITYGVFADTPEIYNPITNLWTNLGISTPQLKEDQYPLSFELPNGKLLVISNNTAKTFVMDVNTPSWTQIGTSPVINGAAVQYRPGKILFTGGGNDLVNPSSQPDAAVLDGTGATPTWSSVAPMNSGRTYHNLVVMPDGKVIALGGSVNVDNSPSGPLSAEIWDPTANTWTNTAPQHDARMYHSTAVLLPDGRILSAGGGRLPGDPLTVDYPTAQIYSPPYLFKGPRPMISSAAASTSYGATFSATSPDAASITSAAFVRVGSVTHTLDSDENYIPLSFTTNGTSLTLTAPTSANVAPAGQYMLFLLNAQGVPAVAKIVQLSGTSQTTPPPTVSITNPSAGATVTGSTIVSASVSSTVGISSVQFKLDGANLGTPVTSAPYQVSWNTTTATNTTHTLSAVATDSLSQTGTAPTISVTVDNPVAQPPTVSMTAPATGATVTGPTTVSASASSSAGISKVQFQLDGAALGSPVTSAPYQITWSSAAAANGPHTLGAIATDVQGQTGTAPTVSVTANNPPAISAVAAGSISQTGATVSWTTSTPSSSEVDYGTTTSYGSVLTNAGLVTSHSQVLTGLTLNTTYHYLVKSTDAANNTASSGDLQFTTLGSTPTTLVGDTKIEANADNNAAGSAEAFQYTATASGSVTQLSIYLDTTNAATKVVVGLYTDSAGSPGTLLTQATINTPTKGAWNNVSVNSAAVTSGSKYWIAALSPTGTGKLNFRDVATGGLTQASAQNNLSTLPATWSKGGVYGNAPMSAYASQAGPADTTPPTVAMSAPAGGATVTGSTVTVSATASDNIAVASVQFLLDGGNLGTPVTAAPYNVTWDSTAASNAGHTLGAKATDTAGNTALATTVSVTVNNPPTISNATITGITPTGAVVKWNTNSPTTSEVDYGLTTSYGAVVSDPALVTSHTETLTNLTPNTRYFCQLVSVDSANNRVTLANLSFTTATVSPTRLLGDATIEANVDWNPAGQSEAFVYTASATGSVNQLSIYLDAGTTATSVIVGLYADNANNPGTLLTSGTVTAPSKGNWNNVTVTSVNVTSGTKYWIAVLSPTGAGLAKFRDIASGGGRTVASTQTNLTTLPATWSTGGVWNNSPMSGYASNVP